MENDAKRLAEWGKDRSILLAFAAQQTAGLVDPLFAILQAMRDKQTTPQAKAYSAELAIFPGNEQWSAYYHSQDRLFRDFCQAILSGMGYGENESADVLSLLFKMLHMDALNAGELGTDTSSEMLEGYAFAADRLHPLFQTASESLRRQIAGEDDPEPHGGFMALMRCPAVKFMVRVFLPCAASFQTPPGILLQNATNGDEKALERLLTADKHALFIPEVSAIYNARMATDFKRCQNTIAKYLTKSPPVVTKRKLKQALGTLLYVLMGNVEKQFRALDETELTTKVRELNTLTLTDVQELFTAFARDSGTIASHETDSDVDDADAFRQAVHRMRKELPPLSGQ